MSSEKMYFENTQEDPNSRPTRDLKSKSFQLRAYIQLDMLGVGGKSFFEVREMLFVVHAAVAHNVDRENPIRVIGHNSFDDRGLVDGRSHRDRVVPWHKHEIGEGGGSNKFALYVVVECDVALKRGKGPS